MLKLGLVQMPVLEGNIKENCKNIRKLADNHALDDIDLLCFPELCISGYNFESAASSHEEETFISNLAAEYHIPILAGIHVIEDGKHYDAACIWNEKGMLLGKYCKMHLWDTENDFFSRGEELTVVPFKGWNIGLLICADYGFPEVSTALALKKHADVLIYPSAWRAGCEDLFSTCCKMRAAENQVYTVALNRASGDVPYCGNTMVASPDGSTLIRLDTKDEAYARIVLKKSWLEEARKSIPWRNMKRYELYEEI